MSMRSLVTGVAAAALISAGLVGAVAAPASAAPAGQLGAWGYNGDGQLGDGTNTSSQPAVSVLSTGALKGKSVVQVDAGNAHTCAVTSDGALACWGSNSKGQLGLGNTTNQSTPQLVYLVIEAFAGRCRRPAHSVKPVEDTQ